MSGQLSMDDTHEERTGRNHPVIVGLPGSRILATRAASALHYCNDCGRELHSGDRMAWVVQLNLPFCWSCASPFCWSCASWRGINRRAEPTRRWAA